MFVLASRSRASCFASRCCFLFAVFASCCFLLLLVASCFLLLASCFVVASLRVASCCFVLLGCLRCFASLACFLLLASCFLLLASLRWLASLRASNFCLVCGSCWALSVRYLCCLTCAVALLMLLDCFAPMRLASRSRVRLLMVMGSLRVIVFFLFCKRVAYGFAPSFRASCLATFLFAYAVNLFWPMAWPMLLFYNLTA